MTDTQIFERLIYTFEYRVLRRNEAILANINATDELRKNLATELTKIDDFEINIKEIIKMINLHTSKLHEKNAFEEIDRIIDLFKSPHDIIYVNDIKGFIELIHKDMHCAFEINDNLINYCAERARHEIDHILIKIEKDFIDSMSRYDIFVCQQIDR